MKVDKIGGGRGSHWRRLSLFAAEAKNKSEENFDNGDFALKWKRNEEMVKSLWRMIVVGFIYSFVVVVVNLLNESEWSCNCPTHSREGLWTSFMSNEEFCPGSVWWTNGLQEL